MQPTKILIVALLAAFSFAAQAADSTSLSADDNVTAQTGLGSGGLMTGAELYKAAKGKSAGSYDIGSDGYLRGIGIKSKYQPLCVITTATCTYGDRTFNLTPGGFQVVRFAPPTPMSAGLPTSVETIPWK